jgi:hypothetical protein
VEFVFWTAHFIWDHGVNSSNSRTGETQLQESSNPADT